MNKAYLARRLADLGYVRAPFNDSTAVGVFCRPVDVDICECLCIFRNGNGGAVSAHYQSSGLLAELRHMYSGQSEYGVVIAENNRLTLLTVDVRRVVSKMRGEVAEVQDPYTDIYGGEVVADIEVFLSFYADQIKSRSGMARVLADELDLPGNVRAMGGMASVAPFVYSALLYCHAGEYGKALDVVEKGRRAYFPNGSSVDWIVRRYNEYIRASMIIENAIRERASRGQ